MILWKDHDEKWNLAVKFNKKMSPPHKRNILQNNSAFIIGAK